MKGFVEFIRKQGVVGLAVGFILGSGVSKVVNALVTDLISPVLSVLLGVAHNLSDLTLTIGPIKFMWGDFVSNLINFIIIAATVYFIFKGLGLDKLDMSKDSPENK